MSQMDAIKKRLVDDGLLTEERWEQALSVREKTKERIDRVLVENGYVPEKALLKVLSSLLGLPYADTIKLESEGLPSNVQESFLRENSLLPFKSENGTLLVATSDPLNVEAINELGVYLGCNVRIVVAEKKKIENGIEEFCDLQTVSEDVLAEDAVDREDNTGEVSLDEPEDLLDLANKAPVIKLVNLIIFRAVRERASDIHIQPYEKELRVRYRVDGILHDDTSPPKHLATAIVSRIKVMANLNIAERRLPQDGRASIKVDDRQIDIRISIVPTAFGERVVMRLLDKETLFYGLQELGLSHEKLNVVNKLIQSSHGIILVTGPTGSGKTTTLYAALSNINSPDKNIITVEDPIEYQLPGISQIQVKPKIGLTFANGLRHIVRQDPDIIMVGEIRDVETAEIAIHASLTGHLVFSTLHTNDAPGAVTRLLDMEIEPFLISSSVIAVIAQRLVRLVCKKCRIPYIPEKESLTEIGLGEGQVSELYRGKGCKDCLETGYRERTAIYEIVVIDDGIRELILRRADSNTIRREALRRAVDTLRGDGAEKIKKGITTIEEVLRVTQ